MTKFLAQANKGGLDFGSDYNRARFNDFLKENEGIRLRIESVTPESKKQRGYYEGCICPLIAYYQNDMNHHDTDDLKRVRFWLASEYLPNTVVLNGKAKTMAGSTKGKLANGFLEKVLDWLIDNYAPPREAIDPEFYKKFRDAIRPFEDVPKNYIDYLISLKILK